jgi:hypothetical protein
MKIFFPEKQQQRHHYSISNHLQPLLEDISVNSMATEDVYLQSDNDECEDDHDEEGSIRSQSSIYISLDAYVNEKKVEAPVKQKSLSKPFDDLPHLRSNSKSRSVLSLIRLFQSTRSGNKCTSLGSSSYHSIEDDITCMNSTENEVQAAPGPDSQTSLLKDEENKLNIKLSIYHEDTNFVSDDVQSLLSPLATRSDDEDEFKRTTLKIVEYLDRDSEAFFEYPSSSSSTDCPSRGPKKAKSSFATTHTMLINNTVKEKTIDNVLTSSGIEKSFTPERAEICFLPRACSEEMSQMTEGDNNPVTSHDNNNGRSRRHVTTPEVKSHPVVALSHLSANPRDTKPRGSRQRKSDQQNSPEKTNLAPNTIGKKKKNDYSEQDENKAFNNKVLADAYAILSRSNGVAKTRVLI